MEVESVALARLSVGTIEDPASAICLVMEGSGRRVSEGCGVSDGRLSDFLPFSTLVTYSHWAAGDGALDWPHNTSQWYG